MKMNVLIVDDCSIMRMIMKRTLKLSDFFIGHIFEAADGEQALRYVDTEKIDLILLDIYMPVMNGIEVLNSLRNCSESKNIPILIVSTESNKSMIEQIKKLSTGFIHKPFTPEILREKINKISHGQLMFNPTLNMN